MKLGFGGNDCVRLLFSDMMVVADKQQEWNKNKVRNRKGNIVTCPSKVP